MAYIRPVINVYTAVLALLLCVPMRSAGQAPDNDLPLPNVTGASIVVKMRYSFMPPLPDQPQLEKDTESVFLIGPDGYAYTRYLCAQGRCSGQEHYSYKDGRLIRRSHFDALDRHTLFAGKAAHRHRMTREDSWSYVGGKVSLARHFAGEGKTLTREIRYTYDHEGRIDAEHHYYPKQSILFYPTKFDYVQYRYDGDTVCKRAYESGRLRDSVVYIVRHNGAGQITEKSQTSADGKHFDRELCRYDSSGRITVRESFSDRPVVQPDGIVLRADRVEYTYDAMGRPDEIRYITRIIKRWAYKFEYLK